MSSADRSVLLGLLTSFGVTVASPAHALAPEAISRRGTEAISVERMIHWLRRLQSSGASEPNEPGSRVAGTLGDRASVEAIEVELRSLGLDVERQPLSVIQVFEPKKRVQVDNLIVHLGPKAAPRLVLIAHLDSRAAQDRGSADAAGWRWDIDVSPGADDNASGCVALLEVARLLFEETRRGSKLVRGVDLVFAAAEEMAMVEDGSWMVNIGAEALVEGYLADQTPVLGAISVDMLLRSRPFGSSFRVYSDGRLGSADLAEALLFGAWLSAPGAEVRIFNDPLFGWSDHASFWQRGLPGVLLIEDDFHHARYHQPQDFYRAEELFYDPKQLLAGTAILYSAAALLLFGDG